MKNPLSTLFVTLLLTILISAVVSKAEIFFVTPDGSSNPPTIAAAVALADSGDVIQLVAGTYSGPGNCDVRVGKTISLIGLTDHTEECVIDCQGSADSPQRALHIEPPQIGSYPVLTLEGVSIINGHAPGASGRGGAILVGDSGKLIARHCVFANNRAYRGGAIGLVCPGNSNEVWFSTFQGNEAFDSGAVGYSDNITSLRLYWSTIIDNGGTSTFGLRTGYISLQNCTVVGNTGDVFGGSDSGWGGYSISNSIVAFNNGPSFENNPDLTASVECSDIYGNSGGNWAAAPVADLYGVDGNFSADPQFCDLQIRKLLLEESSPCSSGMSPGGMCELIGAHLAGCNQVSVEKKSLGSVRGLYR